MLHVPRPRGGRVVTVDFKEAASVSMICNRSQNVPSELMPIVLILLVILQLILKTWSGIRPADSGIMTIILRNV